MHAGRHTDKQTHEVRTQEDRRSRQTRNMFHGDCSLGMSSGGDAVQHPITACSGGTAARASHMRWGA